MRKMGEGDKREKLKEFVEFFEDSGKVGRAERADKLERLGKWIKENENDFRSIFENGNIALVDEAVTATRDIPSAKLWIEDKDLGQEFVRNSAEAMGVPTPKSWETASSSFTQFPPEHAGSVSTAPVSDLGLPNLEELAIEGRTRSKHLPLGKPKPAEELIGGKDYLKHLSAEHAQVRLKREGKEAVAVGTYYVHPASDVQRWQVTIKIAEGKDSLFQKKGEAGTRPTAEAVAHLLADIRGTPGFPKDILFEAGTDPFPGPEPITAATAEGKKPAAGMTDMASKATASQQEASAASKKPAAAPKFKL